MGLPVDITRSSVACLAGRPGGPGPDRRPGQPGGRGPQTSSRKWILVVDDDRRIRTLLTRVLEADGYAIVTAGNGVEACEVIRDLVPHLIILDLRMPQMSGVEFLTHSRRIPVLVVSGYVDNLTPDVAPQANVVGTIAKPFTIDHLRAKVSEALAARTT